MPGRHSSGSNLGGGGSFGGGGASFGGGGGFGGGGWRPRGPWNPQPMMGGGCGFPWILMSILPMFFGGGGGYRRGGGCGCGGLGCLIFLCLFFLVVYGGLGSFGGGGGYYGYNPGSNPGFDQPVNNAGSSGSIGQSPAIQTQTAADLSELHAALDQRISQWERELTVNENHTISGPEAGLNRDNNTREVAYGKCGDALYVFVVLNSKPDDGLTDAEGYAYTTANSPGSCHPPTWSVYDSENVGGGWWFATLKLNPNANQGR
jgi:hypothetical protein